MTTPEYPAGRQESGDRGADRSEATESLRSYGAAVFASVDPVTAQAAASRALSGQRRSVGYRRWIVAGATAGLLAISNVGLATAAESSIPGDSLYGVKRSYERLTSLFGVNHADTRLEEAAELIALGRFRTAIAMMGEALEELEAEGELADALEEAEAVVSEDDQDSPEVADAARNLMAATAGIAEAARAGDAEATQVAIEAVMEQAKNVAEAARANSPNYGGTPPIGEDDEGEGDGGPPISVPNGPPDGAGPGNNQGGGAGQGGPPSSVGGSNDSGGQGNGGNGNSGNTGNNGNRP